MDHRVAVIVPCLLAALSASASAAEVFRWTDEQGRVVYGDRVPEGRKGSARAIDVADPVGQPAARPQATPAAASRASPRTAPAAAPTAQLPATGPAVIGRSQALPKPGDADARCAAAWQRYNESYACFDGYRSGGVVRPEGYAHCEQVLMPSDC